MSIILLLIIFFILFLLLRPLIKIYLAMRKIRKGNFSGINDFFNAPQGQKQNSNPNQNNPYEQHKQSTYGFRKKKINHDVGEYVNFSEIPDSGNENREKKPVSFTPEQQISDVEWVDLPPK